MGASRTHWFVQKELNMNGRHPNTNTHKDPKDSDREDRPLRVPQRVSSCPLPLASGFLTPTQVELVQDVIAMAEAADQAETARARRLSRNECEACRAPEFGSDMSDYLPGPETRQLRAFIDGQCFDDREMLLAVMHAGRSGMYMTVDNVKWLLSLARSDAAHAGAYMTGKSNLASWLKEGLRKFEFYTSRMIRRGRV